MVDKLDKRTKRVLVAFGKHLRQLRESRGMSQAQFARDIGMEPTNLAKIERGLRNLTVDTLVRLAAGLGVPLTIELGRPVRKKPQR